MNARTDRKHAIALAIAIGIVAGAGIACALPVALPLIDGVARIGRAIVGF